MYLPAGNSKTCLTVSYIIENKTMVPNFRPAISERLSHRLANKAWEGITMGDRNPAYQVAGSDNRTTGQTLDSRLPRKEVRSVSFPTSVVVGLLTVGHSVEVPYWSVTRRINQFSFHIRHGKRL